MKILLTGLSYKPHLGGIENSFFHIAKVYKELGHKVIILVGDKTLSGKGRLPEKEIIDDVNVYRFNRYKTEFSVFKSLIGFFDFIKSYFYVKKLNKKYKFDLILTRNAYVGLGVISALKGVKSVYIPSAVEKNQDHRLFCEFDGSLISAYFKYIFYNQVILRKASLFQRILLKKSDFCFVFSLNMKKQISQIASEYNSKISLIHPGVDSSIFFPPKDKILLRKKLDLPEKATIFLILGRIVKVKGIDLTIRAIAELNNSNTYLLIVGNGPEIKSLKNLAIELNIKENILFVNFTRKPNLFFQASDAFLMSSTYESFGQTILEAMSSGLPILGFKSDGNKVITATSEIVEHGVNGFLCEYSTSNFADLIRKFLSTPDQDLKRISYLNRKKVIENYSWEYFCKSLLKVSK